MEARDRLFLGGRDDPDTLAAVLWGGRPLDDAQRAGTMTIQGDDKAALKRFLRLFPMPEPAAAVSAASH